MEADSREQAWSAYTADCLAAITTRIFRWSGADEFEMPLFSEMVDKQPETKQTAEEIKNNILDRLRQ